MWMGPYIRFDIFVDSDRVVLHHLVSPLHNDEVHRGTWRVINHQ